LLPPCQDNEITWHDWEHVDRELLEFTRSLIQLRRDHPVFRRPRWFKGRGVEPPPEGLIPEAVRGPSSGEPEVATDIEWFTPDGERMSDEHWNTGFAKSLGVFLNGKGIASFDANGNQLVDETFYVVFNAHYEALSFRLPGAEWGKCWRVIVDTQEPLVGQRESCHQAGTELTVAARSVVLLQRGV
jgi:glycogen operon protein